MPAVSPGKTVAGAIGGMVVTVGVCWLYARYVLRPWRGSRIEPGATF